MESGKVGLYEIVKANKKKFDSSFGPDDCYEVVANFCGYYDKKTGQRIIYNGYGISRPNIVQSTISKLLGKE
jgi:hypothetical protein